MNDIVERLRHPVRYGTETHEQSKDRHFKDRIDAADEIETLRRDGEIANDVFAKIVQWCRAYPRDVFPEPDWDVVKEKLGSNMLSCVSAANMRHVLKGIEQIIIGGQGQTMKEAKEND